MENVIYCDKSDLIAIADHVREVTNSTRSFNVPELAQAVTNLKPVVEPLEITENGTYTAPDGVDGYSPVTVNVQITTQEKTVTPTTSAQTVKPDSGYDALSQVTVNGDDNLLAENIKSGVSVFGVEGTFEGEGGSSGGGDEQLVALIEGTHTIEIRNSNVKKIDLHGFYRKSTLLAVDFPACKSIMLSAFYSCSNLKSINFPACEDVGSGAFANCISLTTVDFPVCTVIKDNTFSNCKKLSDISFPLCESIGRGTFSSCESLKTADFPVCTFIGSYAFRGCYTLSTANFPECITINSGAFSSGWHLKDVNFPACTTIMNSAFMACSRMETANFPNCTTVGSAAFYYCLELKTIGLASCTTIAQEAFLSCSKLSAVILNSPTVCSLNHSNAFQKTLIASGSGYVFVPASLVDAYKSATNWAFFSAQISAIEDSEFA